MSVYYYSLTKKFRKEKCKQEIHLAKCIYKNQDIFLREQQIEYSFQEVSLWRTDLLHPISHIIISLEVKKSVTQLTLPTLVIFIKHAIHSFMEWPKINNKTMQYIICPWYKNIFLYYFFTLIYLTCTWKIDGLMLVKF